MAKVALQASLDQKREMAPQGDAQASRGENEHSGQVLPTDLAASSSTSTVRLSSSLACPARCGAPDHRLGDSQLLSSILRHCAPLEGVGVSMSNWS